MFAALVVLSALGALSLVGAVSTLRVTARDDYRRVPTSRLLTSGGAFATR